MANIDTILAADLAATVGKTDDAACPSDTVSYTVYGAEAADITALIHGETGDRETDGQGEGIIGSLDFEVSGSDVTRPTKGDTVTFNSRTYKVDRWSAAGGGWWRISAGRFMATEASAGQVRTIRG